MRKGRDIRVLDLICVKIDPPSGACMELLHGLATIVACRSTVGRRVSPAGHGTGGGMTTPADISHLSSARLRRRAVVEDPTAGLTEARPDLVASGQNLRRDRPRRRKRSSPEAPTACYHAISSHRHPTPRSVDPVDEQAESSFRSSPRRDCRKPVYPIEDGREGRSLHGDLGELERDVAGVPRYLRPDLDQILAQRRQ